MGKPSPHDQPAAAERAAGGTPRPGETSPLLSVHGLTVQYGEGPGAVHAVTDVDITLHRGEVLGIVGESGSGKSTLAYAVARLIRPPGMVVGGTVDYWPPGGTGPVDLLQLQGRDLARIRWNDIAMVFQSAMSTLNPVLDVRTHFAHVLQAHLEKVSSRDISDRAVELLEFVGLRREHLRSFPHQLSGGQRQRVSIALALALNPALLIMDEPTTALDVVVQRDIILRLHRLRERLHHSVIFITHDLALLLEIADRVAVMYAGRVVELNDARRLRADPRHPYSKGLLSSFPSIRDTGRDLKGIPGSPPDLRVVAPGCSFAPRCTRAVEVCTHRRPDLVTDTGGGSVACWNPEPESTTGPPADQRPVQTSVGRTDG